MGWERLETARLVLRRPRHEDAKEILTRYAADPEVTRFLSWPRHLCVADTERFIAFSDAEWEKWPAGPFLVHTRDGRLVGGTGYAFEARDRAAMGYLFAKEAWGRGYATEVVRAIVKHAPDIGIRRLHALYHTAHPVSARVLEKCGVTREGVLPAHSEFPNLTPGQLSDVICYAREFGD